VAFPSRRRLLLLALLEQHRGEWFALVEVAYLAGIKPQSPRGRSADAMLNRMYRRGEIRRREVTDEEIDDRGLAPGTCWLWSAAE
jgi:hypothetical protein